MTYFAIAEQAVTDPGSGLSFRFLQDKANAALAVLEIGAQGSNRRLRLEFNRQGSLRSSTMVYPETPEEAADRAERLKAYNEPRDKDAPPKSAEEQEEERLWRSGTLAERRRLADWKEPEGPVDFLEDRVSPEYPEGRPPAQQVVMTPADLHEARQLGFATPAPGQPAVPGVTSTDQLKNPPRGTDAEMQAAAGGPSLGQDAMTAAGGLVLGNPPARPAGPGPVSPVNPNPNPFPQQPVPQPAPRPPGG